MLQLISSKQTSRRLQTMQFDGPSNQAWPVKRAKKQYNIKRCQPDT